MKRSIRDTFVFKALGLEQTIESCAEVNANPLSYSIPKEILEEIYNEFKFKITSLQLKNQVMDDIKSGDILIIDSPECAALQTWMIADGKGGIKHSIVNSFGRIKIKTDGTSQYVTREIFALCVLSIIVKRFFLKEVKILNNLTLIKQSAEAYSAMMIAVIDNLFSIRMSGTVVTHTEMLIRLFFGAYVLEKRFDVQTDQMDSIFSHILSSKKTGLQGLDITPRKLFGVNDGNPLESLDSFFKYLSTTSPLLRDLDVGVFLRKMLMMYGEKSLLMVENFQYFLAYIFTVVIGGNLVKDFQMINCIHNNDLGLKMYTNFLDLTK